MKFLASTASAFKMLLLTVCLNAEQPMEFDPRQQARIDQILALKTEAMKRPGMRSEDGVLGKQVEALMDKIAEATTEVELLNAEKVATENIRAKIILWAADRKARRADYVHFAKEYLNRPNNDAEAMKNQKKFGGMMTPDSNQPDLVKYNRWKELAQRPTEIPSEQRFSSWILSLDDHFDE